MSWVLRNRRFGGWLALAALTLQMVVSFGHVHLDGVHRAVPSVATAGPQTRAAQPLPPQQPGNDADDYCAICATIYLTASSFVPQPPRLPVPFGSARVERSFAVAFGVVEPRRVAFQSRAPPLS